VIEKHKKSVDFWVRQKVLVHLQHKQEKCVTHIAMWDVQRGNN